VNTFETENVRPDELTATGVGFRLEDANDSEFKSQRSRFSFGLHSCFLFATGPQSKHSTDIIVLSKESTHPTDHRGSHVFF